MEYFKYHSPPKIEKDHLQCQSPQIIPIDTIFLTDSGSDLNLIKLASLRKDVIVNDHKTYELKGIIEHFVTILGVVTIKLQIGGERKRTKFQVVESNFTVPSEGILGKPFIIGFQLGIDVLIISEPKHS